MHKPPPPPPAKGKAKIETPEPVPARKNSNGLIIDVNDIQDDIDALLRMSTFEPEQHYWLDIDPHLNEALGSREFGMPYGKIFELSGLEHGGKTTVTTYLAGRAQDEGAMVGYIDVENSRDKVWAGKLGLDLDRTYCLYPRLVLSKKKKKADDDEDSSSVQLARVQSAEDLFAQAEVAMELFRQRGAKKQFWMLDSIAMLSTRSQTEAGTDSNMRTKVDRAMFLSETLPRWASLAANYNAMIILINQIRLKVGMVFGNPEYSPGGRALAHTCSIRAKLKRAKKGGYLRKNGKIVGLAGTIKNIKNKAGNGSQPDGQCGFEIDWSRTPARVKFMPVTELEGE